MKNKHNYILVFLVFTFSFFCDLSYAGNLPNLPIAQAIDSIIPKVSYIYQLLAAFAYMIGVFLAFKCALKFKEHNESKGQVKFITPVLYGVGAALLLMLPASISALYNSLGVTDGANHISGKDSFKDTGSTGSAY